MNKSFDLVKAWTIKNRPQVEPDHQVERYAWLRDNAEGKILSIGCGEAKVEEYIYIKDDGYVNYTNEVCGADLSEDFLISARKRWPFGKFVKYDICKDRLAFDDDTFDTVILGDVIEHVPPYYLHKLLSDALRVCKPHGSVLITTPNGSYFGDNNSSSIYSSDHVIVMTPEVLGNVINPDEDAKKWWIRDGKASHRFKYTNNTEISDSKRFIFIKISNSGGEF